MRSNNDFFTGIVVLLVFFFTIASSLVGAKGDTEGANSLRTGYLHKRVLLQTPAPAEKAVIAYAKNHDELVYALENSAANVELHGHIDLRETAGGMAFEETVLPALINQMRSLRVRFSFLL